MQKALILLAAGLTGGCAAIPPDSDYLSCAGSEKYKVCHRMKTCTHSAVFSKDHIHEGKVLRTEEAECGD